VAYQGLIAETVTMRGHNGDEIEAYYSRPLGPGPHPGVVVIHHVFGLDDWNKEVTRKLAYYGYAAIAPNLYSRSEDSGVSSDLRAAAGRMGGVSDAQALGDFAGAAQFLRQQPYAAGKVGVIGFCSGGRHAYLAACSLPDFDAAVDCWGGGVIVADPSTLNAMRPVAAIDLTPQLACPLLGIFGNDDANPSPEQVDQTEAALKAAGKTYEFHRYDGAGHGFFAVDRANYRAEQATDAWGKVLAFYERHLKAPVPEAVAVS
jgi:carboxymethylenebutenolidase